jgi:hypothetical protein
MDNVQKHNICTNVLSSQTFRSYALPSSLGTKDKVRKLEISFDSEDGGGTFLLNVGKRLPDYTASHTRS